MGGKMRLPLLPILLALTITMLISTSCGAQRAFPPKYWKSKLQRPLLGGAADLPSWIKKTINAQAPMRATPKRFQRGIEPDESQEVDMILDMDMIFDELRREMRAAMEEKEKEFTRTVCLNLRKRKTRMKTN